MNVKDLRSDWDAFGRSDPFWAILTLPEKRANPWQAQEFFETGLREIEELMRYIGSLGGSLHRRKALDFGCGVGRLTQALAGHFTEVHGVDVAPSMIELAEKYNRQGTGCRYHLNDVPSLRLFPDDTFDLIYSNITLQHIDPKDTRQYLKEFVRVLAPRGLAIFQLPSRAASPAKQFVKRTLAVTILRLCRTVGYLRRPIIVMHSLKQEEVRRLIDESGGRIIDIQDYQSAGEGWFSHRYCVTKP